MLLQRLLSVSSTGQAAAAVKLLQQAMAQQPQNPMQSLQLVVMLVEQAMQQVQLLQAGDHDVAAAGAQPDQVPAAAANAIQQNVSRALITWSIAANQLASWQPDWFEMFAEPKQPAASQQVAQSVLQPLLRLLQLAASHRLLDDLPASAPGPASGWPAESLHLTCAGLQQMADAWALIVSQWGVALTAWGRACEHGSLLRMGKHVLDMLKSPDLKARLQGAS